jgi:hypothetical protein
MSAWTFQVGLNVTVDDTWVDVTSRHLGAGTHGMAAAMVKAAGALWDALGGHDPTVTAALTQRSRRPASSSGKRGDKRG